MYHLLILWRQLAIGTIGSHCRPQIDIKGFQCFDHCLTEGHLRGTPWFLVGKPRGEQTSGQPIKGHAADMSEPSKLTAGDVPRYLSNCELNWNRLRSQFFLLNIEHGSTSASLVPGVAVRTLREHGAIAANRLAG